MVLMLGHLMTACNKKKKKEKKERVSVCVYMSNAKMEKLAENFRSLNLLYSQYACCHP